MSKENPKKLERKLETDLTKKENLEKIGSFIVYTTGEAAKICRISPQTIIKLFDEKELMGFYVPGSTHRRIPYKNLVEFMKKHGIYEFFKDNLNNYIR